MTKRLLVLCSVLAVAGCGARAEVAKDKILAQVDSLLGEIDVKQKEAEIGVRKLSAGIDHVTRGKIEAKVKLTQLSDKLAEAEGKIANADKALTRLRDYLKQDKDVEISGKTFTPAQLKEMAETTIIARKRLATEADALKSSKDRIASVVASLEQREKKGRHRLRALKQHLEEIDAKTVALKSIQDAAAISGETAALDFETVEKQVRDLSTKIDVELGFQDEKAKEAALADVGSLATVIKQTSTARDTVAEIDNILGDN